MFRTSTPVSSTWFVNRRRELGQLEAHVAGLEAGAPAWIALLGPRKIGKTSLLLELARRAGQRAQKGRAPPIVFVLIDSFEELPVSIDIFRRYALRTVDALLSDEAGASLEAAAARPADYRALLQLAPRFASLPAALRSWILELPEQVADAGFLRASLDLPEKLASALGLSIVVAWDEFQELTSLSSRSTTIDPLPLARSVWQKHQRVSYVISGSARSMLRELVTAEHSPFFQHFTIVELGPFAREEAVRLLVDASAGERPIPPAVAAKAVGVLGGYPFYLQLLGETLEREPGRLDAGALKAALQELIFSRTGRLALYFEAQFRELVGRSTTLAAALQALIGGPKRLAEVAKAIGAPAGAAAGYLERLGDAVARQPDGRWALDDPTFGLWLSWREPGGTVVPMRLIGDEAERAVAERLARMGFDLIYQSRASRGAFDLLATRGSRQLGVQVKRKRLPVRFTRDEWARMRAEAERFGWAWVIAVVAPEGKSEAEVTFLDPNRSTGKKAVVLDAGAAVDNLLAWTDRRRR
jgi:AAA+ ATPase superfamily predicted ATPase/Holliday junction resolvase